MELKKEKSCGCIIINDNKVLIVYEKDRNFWGFPKGHMEEGETELETAAREVKEEVGLDVDIDATKRYEMHYIVEDMGIDKTTVLFLAKPKNLNVVKQDSEIEIAKWCSFEEAINTFEFENVKEVLKQAIAEL